jgi:hypothetical protein
VKASSGRSVTPWPASSTRPAIAAALGPAARGARLVGRPLLRSGSRCCVGQLSGADAALRPHRAPAALWADAAARHLAALVGMHTFRDNS